MVVTPFLVQNCWTPSTVRAGVLVNHSPWNGQMCSKSLQKISLKSNAASRNDICCKTDIVRLLEHSSSWGSLYYKGSTFQKIIPVLGSPHMCSVAYLFKFPQLPSLWELSISSMYPCLWFYVFCQFILLIRFHIWDHTVIVFLLKVYVKL